MEIVPPLLMLVAAVVGYALYASWRRDRQAAQRRRTLERFNDRMAGKAVQPEVGPPLPPPVHPNDLGWPDLTPGAGRLSYQASTTVASPADVEHAVTPAPGRAAIRVQPPGELPTFADVGGMEQVRADLRDSVGLILHHPDEASRYGVTWNGILLHGPPGTGKTHLARAVAGEFRCSLLHLSTGDLVSGVVGESAQNVQRAFAVAAAHRPCVLFFDEFDSIAARRDAATHAEERRTVNQLLRSLEEHRHLHDLVVVAATNDLDHLDPAVVRAGRFDRHVRVDLPDRQARRAILEVQLAGRPSVEDVDLDGLADRTQGLSAARIAAIVDAAALHAFRDAAAWGRTVSITEQHLVDALEEHGGRDRPTVEDWTWDHLVLPREVKAELRQLEVLLAEPGTAERIGIKAPRGVLLTGPPGTGKTTVARVLAAQARCSFYPVSAADVTSRWVGESERSIQRLFERARQHRPSIVFIDEIDAIGATRGSDTDGGAHRQLTQLLSELDGLYDADRVMVVAATNRPDVLDPALTRGGRLSRRIEIPLPDTEARWAILELASARMPTVGVDLRRLAEATEGLSGADLVALCQQAGVDALVRTREAGDPEAAVEVTTADVASALAKVRAA